MLLLVVAVLAGRSRHVKVVRRLDVDGGPIAVLPAFGHAWVTRSLGTAIVHF
jgi:hypothetical protein